MLFRVAKVTAVLVVFGFSCFFNKKKQKGKNIGFFIFSINII